MTIQAFDTGANAVQLVSNSGQAEPSVSLWVPTNSCVGYNCLPG